MAKQTAVEWLINELHKKQNGESSNLSYNHIFDKAKQMEKQQIIDAFEQGEYTGRGFEDVTSEEYYHINFKSK
jgi:disulfide oxidoreductase YuzD